MSDDEQPRLTNSGVTDPGQDPDAPATATAPSTATGTASTPYGVTGSTTGIASTVGIHSLDWSAAALTSTGTLDFGPQADRPGGLDLPLVSVDLAASDSAIQALKDSDALLFQADDMVALVTGPALKAIVAARVEQVAKHGHTPAADADLPIKHLPHHARSMVLDTIDLLEGPHRNLVVGRRRLAKAAAMLMAAIDRVDVEISNGSKA